MAAGSILLRKDYTFYTVWLHIGLNGRQGAYELECGLRNPILVLTAGRESQKLLLLEIRMVAYQAGTFFKLSA